MTLDRFAPPLIREDSRAQRALESKALWVEVRELMEQLAVPLIATAFADRFAMDGLFLLDEFVMEYYNYCWWAPGDDCDVDLPAIHLADFAKDEEERLVALAWEVLASLRE